MKKRWMMKDKKGGDKYRNTLNGHGRYRELVWLVVSGGEGWVIRFQDITAHSLALDTHLRKERGEKEE